MPRAARATPPNTTLARAVRSAPVLGRRRISPLPATSSTDAWEEVAQHMHKCLSTIGDVAAPAGGARAAPSPAAVLVQEAVRGRQAALRIASADATRRGHPWSTGKTVRARALVKGASSGLDEFIAQRPSYINSLFMSEELDALLENAGTALRRRAAADLEEAVKARAESERSEEEVMADFSSAKSIDERFRSVVRTLLSRGSRADSRLRDALTRLEETIPLMQDAATSARHSLAIKLMAQREVTGAVLAAEVQQLEVERLQSDRRHDERLAQVWQLHTLQLERRDAYIAELQAEVKQVRAELRVEAAERQVERQLLVYGLLELEAEMEAVAELSRTFEKSARSEREASVAAVCSEVSWLEVELANLRDLHLQRLSTAELQRRVASAEAAAQRRAVEMAQARASTTGDELGRVKRRAELESKVMESRLTRKLYVSEAIKEKEMLGLRAQMSNLQARVHGLKLTSSRAKALQFGETLRIAAYEAAPRAAGPSTGIAPKPPQEGPGWQR